MKETYLDGNIIKIVNRYQATEKYLAKNLYLLDPEQLTRCIAKQERRAASIAALMRARTREWEMLAAGGVGAGVRADKQKKEQGKRYARAKAEGRPMVECFTVEREVQHG